MICDFCSKERRYYAYPSYCHHRYCMTCLLNYVLIEIKCVICNQHQQSIIHNLTVDESTTVLPFSDPKKIRKFISNMFLVMNIDDDKVYQDLLESEINKKLYLEESDEDAGEELNDLNIDDE